jgi:hypothetical protein
MELDTGSELRRVVGAGRLQRVRIVGFWIVATILRTVLWTRLVTVLGTIVTAVRDNI